MKYPISPITRLFITISAIVSLSVFVTPSNAQVYTDKEVYFNGSYKILATIDYDEVYSGYDPQTIMGAFTFQTFGDLNHDGIEDIVLSPFCMSINNNDDVDLTGLSIFLFSENGVYVKNNQLESLIYRVKPREGLIADFNKDGRNDYFGASSGLDEEPFPGEQNILLLSNSSGMLKDVSYVNLPLISDFAHGGGVEDIDRDGDLDIFLVNTDVGCYFLINNGNGQFEKDDSASRMTPSLISSNHYSKGSFYDVNRDGYPDLLLSNTPPIDAEDFDSLYYNRLVYNDGTGGFFLENSVALPLGGYGTDTITTNIDPIDLDGDGDIDFIVSQCKNTSGGSWKGQYHQVLINSGDGSFIDDTAHRIPYQDFSQLDFSRIEFPNRTFFADLNSDGYPDMVVNSFSAIYDHGTPMQTLIYINNGDGTFLPLPNERVYSGSESTQIGSSLAPIDFDSDGDIDLVGLKTKVYDNVSYYGSQGMDVILFENEANPELPAPANTYSLSGFDKQYYLSDKLSALQLADTNWIGKTTHDLETILNSCGLTPQAHYEAYGYLEGLCPNQYFNPLEYIKAKAAMLVNNGDYDSIEAAEEAFTEAWTQNPYLHYISYGAAEGIDPSNGFDESQYLSDKLYSLQTAGPESGWTGKTIEDLRAFFSSMGMTVLEHYLSYGRYEGLVPSPVPEN